MRKQKKTTEELRKYMLSNIYSEREDIHYFKQSKQATNFYLKEGTLGLSFHAENLRKGILHLFTEANFKSLPEGIINRKEYEVKKEYGVKEDEKNSIKGVNVEAVITEVPVIRVKGLKDLLKVMLGREITQEEDGRPYIQLREALQELQQPFTFVCEKRIDKEKRTEKYYKTAPLFVITEEKYSTTEDGGEELFSPTYYEIRIANEFILFGIQSSPFDFTELPTHPEKLLKEGTELTKRQELINTYITNLYAEKHSPFLHQKNKDKVCISFTKLFIAMLLKESQYTGKHKSRYVKELEGAIEVIKQNKPKFIHSIDLDKKKEEIFIKWELSLL